MKRILWALIFVMVLFSCNNSSTSESTTSDSSHEGHGTSQNLNTGTNMSMMSIMQKNMNDMKSLPSSGDPDNDFASMMKIHHQGAIEMAQLELQNGTDSILRKMAQSIVISQQKEIDELTIFLSQNNATSGGENFHKEMMNQMNNMKMEMDHGGSVDKQFAEMMIPHHQGGIEMSQAYLRTGAKEAKLKEMANSIIVDQEREIKVLKDWLNR